MSVTSLITDLNTNVFGVDKPKVAKIISKIGDEFMYNLEFIPDLEAGEGGFYRKLKQIELYSKPKNWDPEKCDKSIIYEELFVDVNRYDKCKIIENYKSFMIDVINYFATPDNQKKQQSSTFEYEECNFTS